MLATRTQDACAPYLLPRTFPVGHTNAHEAGATTAVGVSFSGVRLVFVSSVLNSTRSALSILAQPFAVAVNSLHPFSKVSTCAFVGDMSMPF